MIIIIPTKYSNVSNVDVNILEVQHIEIKTSSIYVMNVTANRLNNLVQQQERTLWVLETNIPSEKWSKNTINNIND